MSEKLCRCWSGKPAKTCCKGGDGRWSLPHAITMPSGKVTGYAHPKCYANFDINCSSVLSEEHILQESILNLMNIDGSLTLKGPRWAKEPKQVRPETQVANILCERHNSAFSEVDVAMLKVVQTFIAFYYPMLEGPNVRMFNGYNVERAFLKLITNKIVAGWADFEGKPFRGWKPPQLWLDYLWGRTTQAPAGWGLYVPTLESLLRNYPGSVDPANVAAGRGVNTVPFFRKGVSHPEVIGGIVGMMGLNFYMVMADSDDQGFKEAIYRPSRLLMPARLNGKFIEREIQLAWEQNHKRKARLNELSVEVVDESLLRANYDAQVRKFSPVIRIIPSV